MKDELVDGVAQRRRWEQAPEIPYVQRDTRMRRARIRARRRGLSSTSNLVVPSESDSSSAPTPYSGATISILRAREILNYARGGWNSTFVVGFTRMADGENSRHEKSDRETLRQSE